MFFVYLKVLLINILLYFFIIQGLLWPRLNFCELAGVPWGFSDFGFQYFAS